MHHQWDQSHVQDTAGPASHNTSGTSGSGQPEDDATLDKLLHFFATDRVQYFEDKNKIENLYLSYSVNIISSRRVCRPDIRHVWTNGSFIYRGINLFNIMTENIWKIFQKIFESQKSLSSWSEKYFVWQNIVPGVMTLRWCLVEISQ